MKKSITLEARLDELQNSYNEVSNSYAVLKKNLAESFCGSEKLGSTIEQLKTKLSESHNREYDLKTQIKLLEASVSHKIKVVRQEYEEGSFGKLKQRLRVLKHGITAISPLTHVLKSINSSIQIIERTMGLNIVEQQNQFSKIQQIVVSLKDGLREMKKNIGPIKEIGLDGVLASIEGIYKSIGILLMKIDVCNLLDKGIKL